MLTLLNRMSKLYSIKLLTRGRGVKKVQKYADVVCESPLIQNKLHIKIDEFDNFIVITIFSSFFFQILLGSVHATFACCQFDYFTSRNFFFQR